MPMLKTLGSASARGCGFMQNAEGGKISYGQLYEGGYFCGIINDGGVLYNLVLSPKDQGFSTTQRYAVGGHATAVTIQSLTDGFTNTNIMANATAVYQAARWARSLNINGYTDWYIPARDELELVYRNLKADSGTNSSGARATHPGDTVLFQGSNQNSTPVGGPYSATNPAQTPVAIFQTNGAETFGTGRLMTSTRRGTTTETWGQTMSNGSQTSSLVTTIQPVRVIRRVVRPLE